MELSWVTERFEDWRKVSVGQFFGNRDNLLNEFLEAPNVGFAILDDYLRYVYINRALARMNGFPAEAHLGRTVCDLLGEAGAQVEGAIRQVLTTGQPLPNVELIATLPTRSQPGRWIENYFPVSKDAEGRVKQIGVVVIELDEKTTLQEKHTEDLQQEARRLDAVLEFSASLMSVPDEQDLLAPISDFVRKVTQHEFATLALYDESIRRLRVRVLNSPLAPDLVGPDAVVPASEAGYGTAFLHGEIKLLNRDDLLTSSSPILNWLLDGGVQSVCFLPLVTNRGTLGTLNLGSKQDNAFAPEIKFLKHVADQIAIALDNAAAHREIAELSARLKEEKLYLQDEISSALNFEEIVGESPALKRVLAQVRTVSPSDATVLILGETGTGKELIARAIHRMSARKSASFIKLNCAAIPTGLLESELFGHEKGAFTGAVTQKIGRLELADQGTLFLDEVGEIPPELQPKLLRVLQDQEFERLGGTRTIKINIRLIAATNRDLAKSVAAHEFRSDLYYRLHVFPVVMPPLRERSKDIALLVRYFVQKFARRMNRQIETIPTEAMNALAAWQWPGNVRELENFIERAVILSEGTTLTVPLAELRPETAMPRHDSSLESLEREHILRVLRETGGVIAGVHGAAARLGMKRTTLQSRMQKMGISREEYHN